MNNIKELELLGWRTLIIWECMIRESNDIANLIDFVESWLLLGEASTEIGLVEK
jgi:G:T-mismatch repair DNA endonuclease (very short patch repair protein)